MRYFTHHSSLVTRHSKKVWYAKSLARSFAGRPDADRTTDRPIRTRGGVLSPWTWIANRLLVPGRCRLRWPDLWLAGARAQFGDHPPSRRWAMPHPAARQSAGAVHP